MFHYGDCICFFFFKQKTAYEMRISDWSSDVCSSDLFGRWNSKAPAMTVLDADGTLLEVCDTLLDLIAEHDATLCTGHLSPDETLTIVRAARGRGFRTLVTHATPFFITLEVHRAAADLAAFVVPCCHTPHRHAPAAPLY